jgi:hypothetical protein
VWKDVRTIFLVDIFFIESVPPTAGYPESRRGGIHTAFPLRSDESSLDMVQLDAERPAVWL